MAIVGDTPKRSKGSARQAQQPKAGASASGESSRPAKTKVSLPGGEPGGGSGAPTKRRPPAPPRPWFRRGAFWFAVIVAEAAIALVLSIVYMPRTDDVSIDGADLSRFCALVAQNQQLGQDPTSVDVNQSADFFGRQASALRELKDVAPTDVRPDIDELANLTQQMQTLAQDVRTRNQTDPSFNGVALIEAKQQQIQTAGADAARRLDIAVLKGCGIDLNAPPPSTMAPSGGSPSTTGVPSVGPTVPAPTSSTSSGTGPTG